MQSMGQFTDGYHKGSHICKLYAVTYFQSNTNCKSLAHNITQIQNI